MENIVFGFCSSRPSIVHWLSSPIFPSSVGWLEYKDNDKDKDAKRMTIKNSVLYFQIPDDSSVPSLMVDTSPWGILVNMVMMQNW